MPDCLFTGCSRGPLLFLFLDSIVQPTANLYGKRTIFVGTVTDIYPASLDAYRSLESALNRSDRGALLRAKALILRLWEPVLSSDEARSIQLASSQDELRRASIMGTFPRGVRFRVREWIEGNSVEEFELFTDASDCGYRFKAGKQYLVVAGSTQRPTGGGLALVPGPPPLNRRMRSRIQAH